jgi:hypothetical protein
MMMEPIDQLHAECMRAQQVLRQLFDQRKREAATWDLNYKAYNKERKEAQCGRTTTS